MRNWKVIKRPNSFICSVVDHSEDHFESIIDSCSETHATLIAAAPCMLEAIETVVNKELGLSFDALCILKDAIRKARGETV